jgi:hypothetical protein
MRTRTDPVADFEISTAAFMELATIDFGKCPHTSTGSGALVQRVFRFYLGQMHPQERRPDEVPNEIPTIPTVSVHPAHHLR